MTVELWIFIGTWLLAIGALLGTAHLRNWRIARQKMRVPVAEKLLRGPGESLRKKLEELDEQISTELAVAFVLPLVYVGSILVQQSKIHFGWGGITFFTVVGIAGYTVVCRRIHRVLDVRRKYRLGLGGERSVNMRHPMDASPSLQKARRKFAAVTEGGRTDAGANLGCKPILPMFRHFPTNG